MLHIFLGFLVHKNTALIVLKGKNRRKLKKEFRQVCSKSYFCCYFYIYVWCILVHRALLQRHGRVRVSRQTLRCHCTSSRSRPIVDLSHFKGSRVTAPLQKEKEEAILETGVIEVVIILPPIRAQILRWRRTFFFFFYELP